MKLKMYSVYDEKANAFLPPFCINREEMAMRVFGDLVNTPSHNFGKHPADYTLFELAEFDDSTGLIKPNTANRSLGNGMIYLNTQVNGEFTLEPTS